MNKENVFIVLSLKHSLRKGSKSEWEAAETVEFVNQLRTRHITTASAIGNYTDRTMMTGSRVGMADYDTFDAYIRKKYSQQMKDIDKAYGNEQVTATVSDLMTDAFGNIRLKTVFDL